jgi:hypothetical protein
MNQSPPLETSAGQDPLPIVKKGAGSRGGKSNTERSRIHRLAQKKTGSMEMSVFIGEQAACALQIIMGQSGSKMTQKSALEEALVTRAMQIAPTAACVDALKSKGALSDKEATTWLGHLGA